MEKGREQDFRRIAFSLLGDLLRRIPWDIVLQRRGKNYFSLKNLVFKLQNTSPCHTGGQKTL